MALSATAASESGDASLGLALREQTHPNSACFTIARRTNAPGPPCARILPLSSGNDRTKPACLAARSYESSAAPDSRRQAAHLKEEERMALELRPNCELCDRDLPSNSTEARICSYECTYCADCAESKLFNVCPNCGGDLQPRPIRPATEWRPGLCVHNQPPATKRAHLSASAEDVETFCLRLREIPPEER